MTELIVTIVHGTFAKDAKWAQPTAELACELRSCPGVTHVDRFEWSGGNSNLARSQGSADFIRHHQRMRAEHPGALHCVVAHSHGGNVVLSAAEQIDPAEFGGLAFLSAPFLFLERRELGAIPLRMMNGQERSVRALVKMGLALFYLLGPLFVAYFLSDWLSHFRGGASTVWLFPLLAVPPFLLATWVFSTIDPKPPELASPRDELPTFGAVHNLPHVLVIRSAGDEASGMLMGAQFATWLVFKVWALAGTAAARVGDASDLVRERLRHRLTTLAGRLRMGPRSVRWLPIIAGVGAPIAALAAYSADALTTKRLVVGLLILLPLLLVALVESLLFLAYFSAIAVAVLGSSAALPLVAAFGYCALYFPFGPDVAKQVLTLSVQVDAAPLGASNICLISPMPLEGGDELAVVSRHKSYENPRTHQLLREWLLRIAEPALTSAA